MKIGITSSVLVLLILSMIYYSRYEEYEDVYEYREFWKEEIPETFKRYFKMLLDPLQIQKKIFIHSVFNSLPYYGEYKKKDNLHILISGESWNKGLDNYDIKLIMEETDISNGIICHPYFIIDSYVYNYWPIYTSPRNFVQKNKFCIFVTSDSNSYDSNIRNKFFEKLNKYKKVDSAGGALNNTGIYAPRNDELNGDYSYFNFLSQYKFMICFENRSRQNYLTEKLANAYLGNTVPIYWGASKVRKWFNKDALLQLEESSTDEEMDRLINRIKELDNNDILYNNMYKQPLMYEIPDELNIDKIRDNIKKIIR